MRLSLPVSAGVAALVLVAAAFADVEAGAAARRFAPAVFESAEPPADLLELYTSEGCSSCPPAEAQFARLRDAPGLWRSLVPVAFHVNYWDDLGWPDPYASGKFTERQRAYAAEGRIGQICTPQFVRNGGDGAGSERSSPRGGALRVRVDGDGEVEVAFTPSGEITGDLIVELAPLATGVTSRVRRGENAGRTLEHEFVALELLSAALEPTGRVWTARVTLPAPVVAPITALAVWVHRKGDPSPLQATGGWLGQ